MCVCIEIERTACIHDDDPPVASFSPTACVCERAVFNFLESLQWNVSVLILFSRRIFFLSQLLCCMRIYVKLHSFFDKNLKIYRHSFIYIYKKKCINSFIYFVFKFDMSRLLERRGRRRVKHLVLYT